MEVHRLKALHNLANDILNDASYIRFNEKYFNDDDAN